MKKTLSLLIFLLTLSCQMEEYSPSASYYDFEGGEYAGDQYNEIQENPFVAVADNPVSTFSIDADGASYGNIRRFINEHQAPPANAVRIEELLNYFPLDYEDGAGHPIGLNGEVAECPWTPGNKLIRIGIKGNSIEEADLPPSNFVCLIDVSGSMKGADRIGLVKTSFLTLADQLDSDDIISIVVYAGDAGVYLEPTSGSNRSHIKKKISDMHTGGSTAGGKGIITAYALAKQHFIEGGNNRVILATDGDFNIGTTSQEELVELIESKRDDGIFLTVVGVGRGNLNDGMMEQIADHGNGTYEYIDNEKQAKKVFDNEFHKFYPAAKDVKVQVAFNPDVVEAYRLIGYENRMLEDEDFEDDDKDAGEISVGQNVTALYEIKPKSNPAFRTIPTFTIDFRYKNPDEDTSIPLSLEIFDEGKSFQAASEHMRFTASVAAFGMLLRNSVHSGSGTYADVVTWSNDARTFDPNGHRQEFVTLVSKVREGL